MKSYEKYEIKLSHYLKKRSLTLLRFAMALIFVWFGFLKVIHLSPVQGLVFYATSWIDPHFVEMLGYWEMAIGFCLFFKKLQRVGLILMFLQFPGTFLPLFLHPSQCFTVFPYGLTLEGQYIFKNLILIAAGLVLISSLHEQTAHTKHRH